MNNNKILLYSDNIDDYLSYEQQEKEIKENGSDALDNYINYAYSDFEDLIKNLNKKYDFFVAVGSFGRWDGIYKGASIFANLFDAIYSILPTSCDADLIVEQDNKCINVKVYHHDGTNKIQIRALNKAGEKYFFNHDDYESWKIAHYLFNNKNYSKNIK